jgi:ribosomal protein L31E
MTLTSSFFHRKTLEKRMLSFGFPKNLGDRLQKISKWTQDADQNPQMNPDISLNIINDAEFLHDLFVDVLGYKSPFNNNKTWELEFTPTTVLGFFGIEANHILIEIRIDNIKIKPQVNYPTTEWIIVTDYRHIRLYSAKRIGLFYEEFNLKEIVNSLERNSDYLKRFYFMLCRRTLLGANSKEPARLSTLLIESDEIVEEIINSFYRQYYKIREQLIKDFSYRLQLINSKEINSKDNDGKLYPKVEEIDYVAIAKAQKLLNRIIFIIYGQSHKLLPSQLIINAYQFYNPYVSQPIWENYKAIFSWVYKGNLKEFVFGYGSNLFEFDVILDELLFVGDELCRQIKELGRFDFNSDISNLAVAIILEELAKDLHKNHSITTSPKLSNKLSKNSPKKPPKKLKYSPKILQNYESIKAIITSHLNHKTNQGLNSSNNIIEVWTLRKSYLENLKVCSYECGSGIVLVMVLNILLDEYNEVYKYFNQELDTDLRNKIAQNQIYSCNQLSSNSNNYYEQSRAIAKLNLWLNTVSANQTLVNLEDNLQMMPNDNFQAIINLAITEDNLISLK